MGLEKHLFSDLEFTSFTLENERRELFFDLKGLGKPLKWGKNSIRDRCRIVAFEGKVTFQLPGIEKSYFAKTSGNAYTSVYFGDLLTAFEAFKTPTVEFTFEKTQLLMNDRKLQCESRHLRSPLDLSEMGLGVLNFGEVNAARAEWFGTEYFLLPNGDKIHYDRLRRDRNRVMTILKHYGIKVEDIHNMMLKDLRKTN